MSRLRSDAIRAHHPPLLTSSGAVAVSFVILAAAVNVSAAASSWSSFGHDLNNSRANAQETAFNNSTTLSVLWNVSLGGAITGTPAVVKGVLYVGTWKSHFFAVNATTGAKIWDFSVGRPVDSSPAVAGGMVFFGDSGAVLHALNASTGVQVWSNLTDPAAQAHSWGSPSVAKGLVVIGTASDQECTCYSGTLDFRGSISAYNMTTGARVWKTFTTPPGRTGAAVWSTPAIDLVTNSVHFGTGNAYTSPAGNMTDAMVSVNLTTGAINWVHQFRAGDVWIPNNKVGPDADFAASPNLFFIHGQRVVGEAAKDGIYRVVFRSNGTSIWNASKPVGGSFEVPATALGNGRIYQSYAYGGVVRAIYQTNGTVNWSVSFGIGAWHTSYADLRVFVGDERGVLHMLDARNGNSLWANNLGGGKIQSGIAIAQGHAFVGTEGSGFGATDGRLLALTPG